MSISAQTHLETLFLLDGQGRIVSTREPNPSPDPALALIRRADSYAWALNSAIPDEKARQLARLALDEHPTSDFREPPKHLEEYVDLLGGEFESGPAFEFSNLSSSSDRVFPIDDAELLLGSFDGWIANEIPERSPIMAIIEGGKPVSICFSARLSESAAEAGVETAPAFRGRGLAGLVTAAWAAEIRMSGRTPIYSTSWSNRPSLAVARKLGLVACANYWNLYLKARS